MRNIVVTGVTGKSGRAFVEAIKHSKEAFQGCRFRFSARETSDMSVLDSCGLNYEISVGSLSYEEYTDALLQFDEGDTILLNISGIWCSERLVRSAIKNHVNQLILVHTTGIYSKYKSAGEEYRAVEKRIQDMLAGHPEISLTILRPTMVYGTLRDNNVSVFIKMIDRMKVVPTISGAKFALQPIWCEDLGKAYLQTLEHLDVIRGKEYILSGKEPLLLIDMYHIIEGYLGKKRIYLYVPYGIAYAGAWIVYLITGRKRDYREKVQRMVEPRAYGHEAASRDFGFAPVGFQEGVRAEIDAYLGKEM